MLLVALFCFQLTFLCILPDLRIDGGFSETCNQEAWKSYCVDWKTKMQACFTWTVRPEENGLFIQDVGLLFAVQEKAREGRGFSRVVEENRF